MKPIKPMVLVVLSWLAALAWNQAVSSRPPELLVLFVLLCFFVFSMLLDGLAVFSWLSGLAWNQTAGSRPPERMTHKDIFS